MINLLLSKINNQNSKWSFSKDFSFFKQEGSGNNWAFGYNVHGTENYQKILIVLKNLIQSIWTNSKIESKLLI